MSEDAYTQSFCSRAYSFVRRNAYAPITFAIAVSAGYFGLMSLQDPVVAERAAQEQRERVMEQETRAKRTTLERLMRQPEKHILPAIDGVFGNGPVTKTGEK